MRTLVFCTAYSRTVAVWNQRYRSWLDAIHGLGMADQILLVDDGSPVLPGWSDLRISSGASIEDAVAPVGRACAVLHHFNDRLGRADLFDFPGWYRSYAFGAAYAVRHGFERLIHIESDAFLLSQRLRDYVSAVETGWTALWSEKYGFPELAIQIAAGDGLSRMYDFTRQSYDCLLGQVHEHVIPLSHIEKAFRGDRHGEVSAAIPRDLDYVCQVPTQREATYYWWRCELSGELLSPDENAALNYDFSLGGNADAIIGAGWSDAETGHRWMVDHASTVHLPALDQACSYVLRMSVIPLLHHKAAPRQTLRVMLNDVGLDTFEVDGEMLVGTILPRPMLRGDGSDILTLVHPDGVVPAIAIEGSSDRRLLSLALRMLSLLPVRDLDPGEAPDIG